jgi:hypothetical protein
MNEVQSLVAEINNSISTATKRCIDIFILEILFNFQFFIYLKQKRQHGLLKLASFLEICSSTHERTLFEKNCLFWIKTLFQIFEVCIILIRR